MFRGVLEAQAPPRQNATDTIATLSDRLNNSTLLEDRRSAILGLRSFAKDFPATVASGALRGLISALTRDIADVDTGKVVLETLLNLFNPNPTSPEASDDTALWLADEFSLRQDNITALLELLEQEDFYARLYSLQLLAAISSARPERTQECVLTAPLGTSRLVAVLDDAREPVRSAGLLLLIEVTQASVELQKLVAFEGAFEYVFSLIQAEGSLAFGGVVVQDCLLLLANLINLNGPNQALFRESGFVSRLIQIFEQGGDENEDNLGPSPNRDKNLFGFLALLRMFLLEGNVSTRDNQTAFVRHGLLQIILDLGFDGDVDIPIRAEALRTCADMIRGNSPIQETFGGNQVTISNATSNGDTNGITNGSPKTTQAYVIDALLDTALTATSASLFDVRYAAVECVQAYFHLHKVIRMHFVDRAIYGFTSGEDETSNILAILMGGASAYESPDPYRIWFAALLAFRLLYEEPEVKLKLQAVSEGDAEQGEEVVSAVQSITGSLVAAFQSAEDGRVVVGYLMLLCGWLWEDAQAVDDLLAEGSTVQSLISAISRADRSREVEQGLVAFLLGICYEFSTKDSPIPRKNLQLLLLNGLGREKYLQRMVTLRQHPLVREFEVTPQSLSSAPELGMLPDVYFDEGFMDFFKDNFSRISRCIDKEPGLETARPLEGIDRDLVDRLQSQIDDKSSALEKAEKESFEFKNALDKERTDLRRLGEAFKSEKIHMRSIEERLNAEHSSILDHLKQTHGTELQRLKTSHAAEVERSTTTHTKAARDVSNVHQKEVSTLKEQHKQDLTKLENRLRREMEEIRGQGDKSVKDIQARTTRDLNEYKARVEKDLQQARNEAEKARQEVSRVSASSSEQHKSEVSKLQQRISELESEVRSSAELVDRQRKEAGQTQKRIADQDTEAKKSVKALEQSKNEAEKLLKSVSDLETDFRKANETIEQLRRMNTTALQSIKDKDNELSNLKDKQSGTGEEKDAEIESLKDRHKALEQASEASMKNLRSLEAQIKEHESRSKAVRESESRLKKELKEKEDARTSVQAELDDLLIVLGDLEDKRTKDKAKIKELGGDTSDAEDEDEDEDEADEEEESDDEGGPRSSDVD